MVLITLLGVQGESGCPSVGHCMAIGLYGADNTARCARGIWLSQYIGHYMVLITLLGVQGESGCPSILATVWC